MASADFSQFVVTTANETACETSPVKMRTLSLHVPAAFTRTSSNFWTSVPFATLSVFPSLICGSCPSGQRFAYSFFQIPPHSGHPCCSAMCFVVAYVHSGLTPVRERPCRANKKRLTIIFIVSLRFCIINIFPTNGLNYPLNGLYVSLSRSRNAVILLLATGSFVPSNRIACPGSTTLTWTTFTMTPRRI